MFLDGGHVIADFLEILDAFGDDLFVTFDLHIERTERGIDPTFRIRARHFEYLSRFAHQTFIELIDDKVLVLGDIQRVVAKLLRGGLQSRHRERVLFHVQRRRSLL